MNSLEGNRQFRFKLSISIPFGIEDQADFNMAIDNIEEQSFQGWIRGTEKAI